MAAKLCLKARPTPRQLSDRLQLVDGKPPDGLELYLAAADIADQTTIDGVVEQLAACDQPAGFALLIEGPVDSLDGGDFDVTRDSEADREVVRRLAELARRIGARAVNIHLIAPGEDLARLTLACREELLQRAVPFIRSFVDLTRAEGSVPTIENMPPVLRMRRAGFAFTPIGMASADLLWMVERVPGLEVLPDTSHAGLYLNARSANSPRLEHAWVEPLLEYVRQLPSEPDDLLGYMQLFEPVLANAQISNAAGLLGEGLPYGQGNFDLDPVIVWLDRHAQHIVTETLESNSDEAVNMRDALRRMRAIVG